MEQKGTVSASIDLPGRRGLGLIRDLLTMGSPNYTNGKLEFCEDGLWFRPGWWERNVRKVERTRMVIWDDVWMISVAPSSFMLTTFSVFRPDRTYQYVGQVFGSPCADHLRRFGFEPHRIASWPGKEL